MITNPLLLYTITVLIWGSTWLAIKFQIGIVPLEYSVAYRFLSASLILFLFCFIKGTNLRLTRKQQGRVILLGLFIFCLNYIFTYYASKYLASGLVALCFSLVTAMNILNGRIILKEKTSKRVLLAALGGLVGLALVFYEDLLKLEASTETLFGLALALTGAYMASMGNIISAANQKQGISILALNTYGMLFGGLATLTLGLLKGLPLTFDPSMSYVLSLFYLSVFGSIIAFGAYFSLLMQIGPVRASYATVLFPVVALTLSTFFENYKWTLPSIIGLIITIGGNIFIMRNKKVASR